ncbi:MAG: PDZ domain-containing protein [Armatimonas sp.]
MNKHTLALLSLGIAALPLVASAQNTTPHGGMLRYPTVSATEVAFVYAGKLWRAPRTGGVATPVASPAAGLRNPRFSPDGATVAFTGNYDGNDDIYTIPTVGGEPQRVTHHPGPDELTNWTADGHLTFSNPGMTPYGRFSKLLTVSAKGGMPEALPVPYGEDAMISPDGRFLAYTPSSTNRRTWKRYRGGWAQDIWVFDLQTKSAKKITDWEGTDTYPMWADGKTIFYLSDNGPEHRLNIWKYDVPSGKRRQITKFSDYDIKAPSYGAGAIVFQQGAKLRLLDVATEKDSVVEITIPGDRLTVRPKVVDARNYIESGSLSPSGKRAALEARGDIWTNPAKEGSPRNLTHTSFVRERNPVWSPDGASIVFVSDITGEYELYTMPADGKGEPKQLTTAKLGYPTTGRFSPDGKRLTITDKSGSLYILELETKKLTKVAQVAGSGGIDGQWSPDSRWLVFANDDEPRGNPFLVLYSVETGKSQRLTSGMFADYSPIFDRKGEWIYFVSRRSFQGLVQDENLQGWVYTNTGRIIAVPLKKTTESPFLPKSDEEPGKPEEKKTASVAITSLERETTVSAADDISGTWTGTISGTPQGDASLTMNLVLGADGTSVSGTAVSSLGNASVSGTFAAATKKVSLTVKPDNGPLIPFVGAVDGNKLSLSANVQGLTLTAMLTKQGGAPTPAPAGNAATPKPADDKKPVRVEVDVDGFEDRAIALPIAPGDFQGSLGVNAQNQVLYWRNGRGIMLFDMNDATRTEKVVNPAGGGISLSADGTKLFVNGTIQAASAGSAPEPIVVTGMNVTIDQRAEWGQLLRDAWRLERDYFYDPNMHGVDWPAVLKQYEAMLPDAASRADVGFIISELISELNVGHAYYSDDQGADAPRVSVGMLGCDFEKVSGAYRIAKIYRGAPWDTDAMGPLSQPGVKVGVGDYILAVNGVPIDPYQDPWAAFQDMANRAVVLTVSSKPTLDKEARDVTVRPIGSEGPLRYRAWIEENRKKVEALSGGKVGYIYVPDTGTGGQADLVRQFVGQLNKPALLIDDRWNGGGQIPTRFIELLNRPMTNLWAIRDGKDSPWPPDSHQGPKAMLINGLAGSGGDCFPYYFRQAKLGKLIGMRTWGGLVGLSGNPGLMDGSSVTVPTFAFYENDGTWAVEGHGVDPDIEVLDDPSKMQNGGDPQIEAAVRHLLEEIKRKPFVQPARPKYPNRAGMGIKKEDQ